MVKSALCVVSFVFAASAVSVRETPRAAVYQRGDVNVKVVQAIDAADWIWAPGHVRWEAKEWTNAVTVRAAVHENPYGGRVKGWMLYPADRPEMRYEVKTPGRIRAVRNSPPDSRPSARRRRVRRASSRRTSRLKRAA